ncbi:hypothetical protein DFH27DRAFT_609217 [Peziza echinospora]|nr:hypothetical protein DFH27DRAFT_609217 [Peziza echinospora]
MSRRTGERRNENSFNADSRLNARPLLTHTPCPRLLRSSALLQKQTGQSTLERGKRRQPLAPLYGAGVKARTGASSPYNLRPRRGRDFMVYKDADSKVVSPSPKAAVQKVDVIMEEPAEESQVKTISEVPNSPSEFDTITLQAPSLNLTRTCISLQQLTIRTFDPAPHQRTFKLIAEARALESPSSLDCEWVSDQECDGLEMIHDSSKQQLGPDILGVHGPNLIAAAFTTFIDETPSPLSHSGESEGEDGIWDTLPQNHEIGSSKITCRDNNGTHLHYTPFSRLSSSSRSTSPSLHSSGSTDQYSTTENYNTSPIAPSTSSHQSRTIPQTPPPTTVQTLSRDYRFVCHECGLANTLHTRGPHTLPLTSTDIRYHDLLNAGLSSYIPAMCLVDRIPTPTDFIQKWECDCGHGLCSGCRFMTKVTVVTRYAGHKEEDAVERVAGGGWVDEAAPENDRGRNQLLDTIVCV